MNDTRRAGQVKEVTSLAIPVIKDIRGLALKKNRDIEKRFLGEGLKLVTDALDGGWPVHVMVYAKRMAHEPHFQAAAARARARGALILEVSEKVLGAISRRDNPQMAIAVFGQRWTELAAIRPKDGDVWLALDRVRDPGNLGTIIRTVDGVGAKGVILVGETTDPWNIEAVRATMGSLFHVPLARASQAQFLQWRKGWPGLVAGTHLEGSVDYRSPDYSGKPVLLMMGNEQQGLPGELAQSCDVLCRIPMAGAADSLNLAVATGVMLYEVRRAALKDGTA
ncbi:MAG TPA: RNA methyltransferase [Rhizobiaceae bacterium]|nr:RNA methyltransferase [Rhizobiaceae bacterium]